VIVAFALNTANTYSNGITIPLKTPYPSETTPGITFTITPGTSSYISPSFTLVTAGLTCNTVSNTIQVTTKANFDTGMVVSLYGTLVTIDPTLTPSTISINTPITYSSGKTFSFSSISTNDATRKYTIYPQSSTIASIPNDTTSSGTLNTTGLDGTITVYANSYNAGLTAATASSSVYTPKSISAVTNVRNYATLLSGKVVPFVNTYNTVGTTATSLSSSEFVTMYINFTQNVTLEAVDL
jgi:hypothetical protein